MKLIYLFIFVISIITASCQKHSQIQPHSSLQDSPNTLQMVPEKDQKALTSFFQLVLCQYNFAYTLFGEKPVSIVTYFDHISSDNMHYPREYLTFTKEWKIWQQYASLFPSNTFVLKQCYEGEHVEAIFMIHKKHAAAVIAKNLSLFRELLGDDIEPKKLVEELCSPETSIIKTLHGHSGLFGILLGYGKNNAMAFERKVAICKELDLKMTPPFSAVKEIKALQPTSHYLATLYRKKTLSLPKDHSFSSPKGSSIANELNMIIQQERMFELYGSDFFLEKFASPVFMAQNEDLETEELHAQYLVTRKRIYEAYHAKPFLETTLNQWMCPK